MRNKYDFLIQTKKYKTPRGYVYYGGIVEADPSEKVSRLLLVKQKLLKLLCSNFKSGKE